MTKNYYEILEVSRDSSQEEIKKSYKKLALKYHPDKNKDNEEKKNKFKEIAEAYDTLGDEQKRKTYNLYGSSEINFAEDPFSMFNDIFSSHMSNFMNMNYEQDINLNDILGNLSGFSNSNINIPMMPNIHFKMHTFSNKDSTTSKLFQNIHDQEDSSSFFNNNEKSPSPTLNIVDQPEDIYLDIDVSLEEICSQEKKEIIIDRHRNKNGSYKLREKKIEVYVYDREIILEKNGNEVKNGKKRSDIYLHFHQKTHPLFTRINDYDLLNEKNISLKDIYNGFHYELKLPNKHLDQLNIYSKTKDFYKNKSLLHKVLHKGIPYLENNTWHYGHLFIKYNLLLPSMDELYDSVSEIYEDEEEQDNNIEEKDDNIEEQDDNIEEYNDKEESKKEEKNKVENSKKEEKIKSKKNKHNNKNKNKYVGKKVFPESCYSIQDIMYSNQ